MQPTPRTSIITSAVARMNLRLMPLLLLMYVMAFLDRTNVGFAKTTFQASVGISEAAYAFGASIFFVGYALLEVPSNILLTRFGARRWLARIMISWGLVSAAMFLVRDEWSFYALRLLLGMAEAGLFPGLIYYVTRFYPPEHRAHALGLLYLGAPISFIVGGPISGALLTMDGLMGLAGWQWLFLVEGLATSVIGVLVLKTLPDRIEDIRWLAADEREALTREQTEGDRPEDHRAVLAALRSPAALRFGAILFIVQSCVYGLVFFMPGQIATALGRQIGPVVGVVSALPWLCALIATVTLPRLADRTGRHVGLATILFLGISAGLLISVLLSWAPATLLGLGLAAAGLIAVQPVIWSLASIHLPEHQRAASIALINSIGATGSFVAPNVRVAIDRLFDSSTAGMIGLSVVALAGVLLLIGLSMRPRYPL